MRLRWAWVAVALLIVLAPVLFAELSMERLAVWMARVEARDSALLARGLYPLHFDLSDREQLIGQAPSFARAQFGVQGLQLRTTSTRFDFRLSLRAKTLRPAQVDTLRFAPQASQPGRWFFIVREHNDGADWTAALPSTTPVVTKLRSLAFVNPAAPTQVRTWTDFVVLRQARIYGEFPVGTTISITEVGFGLAPDAAQAFQNYAPVKSERPERWLRDYAAALEQNPSLLPPEGAVKGWEPVLLACFYVLWWALALVFLQRRESLLKSAQILRIVHLWSAIFVLSWGFQLGAGRPSWIMIATLAASLVLASRGAFAKVHFWGERKAWLEISMLSFFVAMCLLLSVGVPERLPNAGRLAAYFGFAFLQQSFLQLGLYRRLALLVPAPLTIAIVAVLFACWHVPNFMLMCLCLIGGVLWSWQYQRHRALLPLVVSHAVLGWLCVASLPPELLRNAEISARFFLQGASTR